MVRSRPRPLRRTAIAWVGVVSMGLLSGCVGGPAAGPGASFSGGSATLHLVGFSVPKEADSNLEKSFAATPAGAGVRWEDSFGASGDQSRAVANGLNADLVHFSVAGDVTRLVQAGLVAADWDAGPTHGILSTSEVVIVVPKGNPQRITGWSDLTKPDVKIITPNPASSGSARWNILAAYQQVISSGGTPTQARDYLTRFFDHVVALPGSGRDATNAFLSGSGNVLISYEAEAILARQSGEDFDYIVPDATLRIDNPAALTTEANPLAREFLDFALSPAGQREYARSGFRPVLPGTAVDPVAGANDPDHPFPLPSKEFTIGGDLGGWDAVNATFFDEATGIVPQIQRATGKAQ